MKHYDSIPRIQDDGTLKGETVWGYNKLDGQNFCVTYNCRKKTWGPYGSRTVTVDENSEQFGDTVRWFNDSNYKDILEAVIKSHSGKRELFNGVDEITFFFEWYGDNSFAGKHQEGDNMRLALIDVFLKKRGYIEPKDFELFRYCGIFVPELIYTGEKAEIKCTPANNHFVVTSDIIKYKNYFRNNNLRSAVFLPAEQTNARAPLFCLFSPISRHHRHHKAEHRRPCEKSVHLHI